MLFTPCATKEHLSRWVQTFIGIHFPDAVVCEESNSSPMDALWTLYSKAISNDDEDFSRVMSYAARGTYKTLSASVLEVALVLHTPRNIAHLAATQDQSGKAQSYCRDFFAKPYLCDFRMGQNIKKIDVCRFSNERTGIHLTEKEWQVLSDDEKTLFERKDNYIQIVTLTLQGANSAHTELLVVDEVDTVPTQNRGAYEEAKHIPDPRNGLNPITLLTSTRKFSYGLVQKEIDEAAKSGLKVFHWNAVDVAQACTPDRHKPELPKVQLYVNDSELTTVSEEAYSKFDVAMQSKFTQHEGFGGCATCSLFSVCKSRLATHQTSKSPLLKPITWLRNRLKEVSTGMALTQIMCRQPDSTGLIYPKLDRAIHVKTASEIAQMVTGRTAPQHLDKGTLLRILVDRGCKFVSGMDFGFTHPFSCITMAVWGQNAFVVDCVSRSGLELDDKVAVCEHLRVLNPTIHADTEAPADIETFKRRGFQMKGAIKGRGSVKSGIEIVRMKIQPALGPPTLFFLAGDPDVEFAFQQLKMYHFVTDEGGNISDEPEKVDDDSADAARYGIVGTFAPNHKISLPQNPNNPAPSDGNSVSGKPQWMQEYISKLLDGGDIAANKPIRKGNFHFQQ